MKKNLFPLLLIAGMASVKADNITVDGVSRSYNVYAPNNLGENRPLLIFLSFRSFVCFTPVVLHKKAHAEKILREQFLNLLIS